MIMINDLFALENWKACSVLYISTQFCNNLTNARIYDSVHILTR